MLLIGTAQDAAESVSGLGGMKEVVVGGSGALAHMCEVGMLSLSFGWP